MCLLSNKEIISRSKNECDESAPLDLCPMLNHYKYRQMFHTQKIDRDLPQPKYEERTIVEKVTYNIKYPKDYDKRVYDFYSWRYYEKKKQQLPKQLSETISSVDSD